MQPKPKLGATRMIPRTRLEPCVSNVHRKRMWWVGRTGAIPTEACRNEFFDCDCTASCDTMVIGWFIDCNCNRPANRPPKLSAGDKLKLLFLMCFDKWAAGLKQSSSGNEVWKFMSV